MLSLKQKQSGFTIVELLIVIVIIGILAGLVITTFVGIQARGRDSERQTDLKALQGQLEAYYADKGGYPTATDINNSAWRTANKFTIDPKALQDPKGSVNLQPTTNATQYGYVNNTTTCVSPTTDTGAAYTGASAICSTYTLTATKEASSGTLSVSSQT